MRIERKLLIIGLSNMVVDHLEFGIQAKGKQQSSTAVEQLEVFCFATIITTLALSTTLLHD
jgi:hypothetical protein